MINSKLYLSIYIKKILLNLILFKMGKKSFKHKRKTNNNIKFNIYNFTPKNYYLLFLAIIHFYFALKI